MDPATRLPDELAMHALAFERGELTPAAPRDAATVVLLREWPATDPAEAGDHAGAGDWLQVYLLRRQASMAFAAGMSVFPGGRVDPRDFDHEIGWAGPPAAAWAARMGVAPPLARALVCAAVRETFEESGVLLAGPSEDEVVVDTRDEEWEPDRKALESRSLSFTDLLDRRGLVVRTDLLRYWGAWVTPAFEPRRYDTRFFVAALPAGQVTRDVSTESDRVAWLATGEALDEVDEGRMLMLPPTYVTCAEVHEHGRVEAVLAAAGDRDVTPVVPRARAVDDRVVLDVPERLVELARRVRAARDDVRREGASR